MEKHKKYMDYKVVIWGYPYGKHTHSWIHFAFHRAFLYLGFDTVWVENKKENLPSKHQKTIFVTAHGDDSQLMEHLSPEWIVFNHNYVIPRTEKVIPFGVQAFSFASYPPVSLDEYRHYLEIPKILWGTDLLPNEIKFHPYHYKNDKDVRFIGSWWFDNWKILEKAHLWCLKHGKHWDQQGKHIFLRYKKFVPEDQIAELSREAYLTLSIQGKPQCDTGYVPCRLLKNMSYSVLGISNNLFMANLFADDEIIIDRDIFTMMEKAEKVVKDRKVDLYTKKALENVKANHTYISRIQELFSYLP